MPNLRLFVINKVQNIFRKYGFKLSLIDKPRDYKLEMYQRLYRKNSLLNRSFYNIGAGLFFHPYWTNIDHNSEWDHFKDNYFNNNIEFDLLSLKSIPIKSNSAEVVYSSHTVEHITDKAAQNMFNESYRILKKGGCFRITMPNIDLHYRAYKENDKDYFFWIDYYSQADNYKRIFTMPLNQASISDIFIEQFAATLSPIAVVGEKKRINAKKLTQLFNDIGYEKTLDFCTSLCSLEIQERFSGNHINWWNKNKSFRMLKKAGFKNMFFSACQQSFSPILRDFNFFDNTNPQVSLYIEAIKL